MVTEYVFNNYWWYLYYPKIHKYFMASYNCVEIVKEIFTCLNVLILWYNKTVL